MIAFAGKVDAAIAQIFQIYPAIARDSTAFNWRRKREIFAESRFFVATPCSWLMRRVENSILAPAVHDARVIPNGIDLNIFRPIADREAVRKQLGINLESKVVVFAAHGIRNKHTCKDYNTFRAAIGKFSAGWSGCPVLILALGDDGPSEEIGRVKLKFISFNEDALNIALYLNAADVYVHSAKADTFPNAVIEALACGTPVIASAVGGIPEQFEDKEMGFLVSLRDATEMAVRIEYLLHNDEVRQKMGGAAQEMARRRFDLRQQAEKYLDWYRSILDGSTATLQHNSKRRQSGVPS
ncbi:MAG: glycosyltransferase [Xanthobacteraceae bacterium]